MANAPSPAWKLPCHWCDWYIVVNARGMRGEDLGSGVEAAERMEEHIIRYHDKTWTDYIKEGSDG